MWLDDGVRRARLFYHTHTHTHSLGLAAQPWNEIVHVAGWVVLPVVVSVELSVG